MWLADMDFEVPSFIYDELKKRINHRIFGYTYLSDSFYEAIIYWFNNFYLVC